MPEGETVHPALPRLVLRGGLLLINVAAALLGTMILELPFERYTVVSSLRESMFIMDLLTSVFAFGLGWIVYYRWRPAASKWVWAVGLCWFGQRALFPPDGNHVMLWEVVATRAGSPDWAAMGNWTLYTVLPLRLIFYSAGALACAHIVGMRARTTGSFR